MIAQHESPYAITVGAVDAGDTPAFGTSPPVSEPFSSSGLNTEYLLAPNGSPLTTPEQLPGVAVCGLVQHTLSSTKVGRHKSLIPLRSPQPSR